MRKVNYYFFCLLFAVAVMAGCKKDDGGGPSPEAAALAKLQGTWVLKTAMKDGPINGYENMKLTIKDKNISATGTPVNSVFPQGTFTFVGTDFKKIVVSTSDNRGDINVEIPASTENALTMKFDLKEDGTDASSRIAVVQGEYIFTFTKE